MNVSKASKHLILGSGSQRRLSLLNQIGVKPDLVLSPNVNEKNNPKELPIKYVRRMAIEKNKFFHEQYNQSIILTADTIVSIGKRILPKAINKKIAEECLRLISGRRHNVFTSFTLFSPDHPIKNKTVKSIVKFKRLHEKEIAYYLESNEWEGKAGGYAIQGKAASFVNFLSGSYSNVVGLPLAELYRMLMSIEFKLKND